MSLLPLIALAGGLAILVWCAGWFVDGASALARHLGMPPLLVGMVVVGFGTSAPEVLISTLAAFEGNFGLALANAYGANSANIGVILGLTALLSPVAVRMRIVRREMPVLIAVTLMTIALVYDLRVTRLDAMILLGVFAALVVWSVLDARRRVAARPAGAAAAAPDPDAMPLWRALGLVVAGLAVLVVSAQVLVWGAVQTAQAFGISDIVIGLTIVAVGTSMPELAATITAVRRRAHDMAMGNIIGSNLFNTLAVVGIAAMVRPMQVPPEILNRDLPVMTAFTFALVLVGIGLRWRLPGRITRIEGAALLAGFAAYTVYLVTALPPAPAG